MFIPNPGSWFLPIPDPGSRILDPGSKNSNKRERWKKIWCHNFLCSHKFHKIENYFSFEVLKKKIWANFQRIIELFTQKIVTKLSEIWVWDPGSEIWDPGSGIRDREKAYSGSRIQGSKRHRIPYLGSGSATLWNGCGTTVSLPDGGQDVAPDGIRAARVVDSGNGGIEDIFIHIPLVQHP
jgi:hypothetical protein